MDDPNAPDYVMPVEQDQAILDDTGRLANTEDPAPLDTTAWPTVHEPEAP